MRKLLSLVLFIGLLLVYGCDNSRQNPEDEPTETILDIDVVDSIVDPSDEDLYDSISGLWVGPNADRLNLIDTLPHGDY